MNSSDSSSTSLMSPISPDHSALNHHQNAARSHTARNRSSPMNSNISENTGNDRDSKFIKGQEVYKYGLLRSVFITGLLVVGYFLTSIGLTFYQKWITKRLHHPLSIVMCHLLTKFILAASLRILWESWTKSKRPTLPWKPYVSQIGPAGIASALDIGLSNWSFEFITVSLYTMSKSTAIIFVMGFGLFFKLEKKHWTLLVVVVMISGGLVLFTYQATQFNLAGFIMVMSASFLSGLRWTLSQMVIQRSEMGLSNPIDMIYHIQPWMILTLLPFSFGFEGLDLALTRHAFRYENVEDMLLTAMQALVGSLMAFFMEIMEYLLVSVTSSLTFAVCGIIKEVVTLTLAVVVTHDELSTINAIGLVICLIGISLHVTLKAIRLHEESKNSSHHIRREKEEELLMDAISSDGEETV